MLLLDKVMYVQSAQQGDKFVKYDLDDPNNPLGPSFTQQLDPNSSMEALTQAVSSVSSQGSENVAGQKLDHYAMTIDPSKLAKGQTAGTPAELVVDVWLDDQDRMVQTKMDLGAVKYLATLSNLDGKVTLEAPPDEQGHHPARRLIVVRRPRRPAVSDRASGRACPSCSSASGPWAGGRPGARRRWP